MTNQSIRVFVNLALLTVICCGCGGLSYRVRVNGFGDATSSKAKSYWLLPVESAADVELREQAVYIHKGLMEAGFIPAGSYAEADVLVMFVYDTKDGYYYYNQKYFILRLEGYYPIEGLALAELPMEWKLELLISGTPNHRRQLLPVLVATGVPYYGRSSTKVVESEIDDDDPLLERIRMAPETLGPLLPFGLPVKPGDAKPVTGQNRPKVI